ncbi:MBL fold metallo-hydrolase [Proteus sp. CA142267]|uniref:MBL fold metallo-hydrolase n=1 Tax=Proteus sp. CA142267 TaxID=2050965 RepID=UPI000D6E8360|nr:MBL fold metallo-hydrolase [Proteus sp. CA142267]
MMIRTFHPIGQGAFYTEEFDNFTFVYDCGTDTDGKKRIGKYVSNHFDINEEINFLFISHFHRDHINGLEYLLSKYTVKRIFIPQYDIYERVIELFNTSNEGDYEKIDINLFDNKLILDPIETIKSISIDTEVTLVRHDYGDSIIEDDINDYEVSPDNYLNSGEILSSPIPNWIFIPINYKDKSRSHVFSEELKKLNIEFRNTDDFVKVWSRKDKRKNVINTFRDLSYSPNENSMVVYSGSSINNYSFSKINHISLTEKEIEEDEINFERNVLGMNESSCIYFGDYEAKNKGALELIKNRLKEYYNSVCTIQIPHHGSFENYSKDINERHNIYSVISYGEKNRHGHPSPCTRKLIEKNAGILFEVTEKPSTILRFFIDER